MNTVVTASAETKSCTACHLELPLDHFGFRHKQAGKLQSWCRSCRSEHQEKVPRGTRWWMPCSLCGKTFERIAKQGERRTGNAFCSKECRSRAGQVKIKFGLTAQEFRAMWQRQGGLCAMPGCLSLVGLFGFESHVDHDHVTGDVRGLLCRRCNTGLGWYELMRAVGADLYLQEVVVSTP